MNILVAKIISPVCSGEMLHHVVDVLPDHTCFLNDNALGQAFRASVIRFVRLLFS